MRGLNNVKTFQDGLAGRKMGFGWLMVLMLVVCVTYAHLIPTDVLSRYPSLAMLVQHVEGVLPAIRGQAKYSPIPEVVRLYLSTLWVVFPFFAIWFIWYDFMRSRVAPPRAKGVGLMLLLIGAIALSGVMLFLLGFFEPVSAPGANVTSAGRGNAYYAAMIGGRTSMAILSVINYVALCISVNMVYVAVKHLFKGGK